MADAIEDFWPKVFLLTDPPAPVALLETQASLLAGKTGGQIEGVVETSLENDKVYYSLYLKVDALGDYLYRLIDIAYPEGINSREHFPVEASLGSSGHATEIYTAEQFHDWLREALSSSEVQATIGNLLRYIRESRKSSRVS